ncbi:uncharacterized protein MONOS_3796 [Monocercomonoides exilis]|uniref:uncharacterized protein n=1 Tax=Monocercomonoides exilis TaxID=2049356 RepID=UPI00355A9229|nr:hypothetical protein MONOS_3796 [Monocercomonoides exilis]|eukprot:MONOS_3796.1-p1 / transcript=MONOS_3796.1 / gene=MONOS_3796 / organism=Monocercomonoides_exilis_PA203 / gene_product=unspecified product / transcript_product=unspecified product / location=Mono_scaffold00093:3307-4593(-) / protein_length=352 / sequence_SO=supercontig / SO=protein_coding / is_pseudo=false
MGNEQTSLIDAMFTTPTKVPKKKINDAASKKLLEETQVNIYQKQLAPFMPALLSEELPPGVEEADTSQCQICCFNFEFINKTSCCDNDLCTDCYFALLYDSVVSEKVELKCPFCQLAPLLLTFKAPENIQDKLQMISQREKTVKKSSNAIRPTPLSFTHEADELRPEDMIPSTTFWGTLSETEREILMGAMAEDVWDEDFDPRKVNMGKLTMMQRKGMYMMESGQMHSSGSHQIDQEPMDDFESNLWQLNLEAPEPSLKLQDRKKAPTESSHSTSFLTLPPHMFDSILAMYPTNSSKSSSLKSSHRPANSSPSSSSSSSTFQPPSATERGKLRAKLSVELSNWLNENDVSG